MKNRWLSHISLIVATVLLCSCSSAPELPEKVGSIPEFEQCMNRLVESGSPPGLSIAVVKGDSVVYSKGFGWADEPRSIRATAHTVYHWWSCTKIATAIAILQLQEKGKLSLEDRVVRHLPFFEVQYPSDTSRQITVLHLLNHTSGLPDPSGLTFVRWIHHEEDPPVDQTEFIRKVLPDYSRLKFEPGDRSEYSNIGYMVLGAIIEKVSGMTYEEYIRRNVLQPLGMNRTDFLYTKAMAPDEAAGAHPAFSLMTPLLYLMAGSYVRELDSRHLWMERVYTDQTPSTALIGSVTDAARLVGAYLNGGMLNGRSILTEGSIATMTFAGQTKGTDDLNYRRQGICWRVYGSSGRWCLTHDGGGPGFSTKIQLYPDEKLGIILFTNDVTCEVGKIVSLAGTVSW